MRITDLLDARSILLDASPKSKSEALDQIVDLMVKSEKINDKEAYRKQVYAREEESTTGIGEGIAIPHGKCDAVTKPGLAAMVVKDGVDFDSLDGELVTLMFLIAAPNTEDNIHLDVLSKLSVLLMNEEFTESLRNAKTVEEFMNIINDADEKEAGIDERLAGADEESTAEETTGKVKILAVTSCPTGIAHTYMAAEGIEKAAKAKECAVKVETRGSGGAKNVLTEKEIQEADCIIVAADAKVPMERFHGKKLIECQVSDGISKADALVERAIKGDAPVYQAGTLSGNPIATAAGLATLRILKADTDIYMRLQENTAMLADAVRHAAGNRVHVNQIGSLMSIFFTGEDVTDYDSATTADTKAYADYFGFMLDHGIYVAPSQFESMFVSDAHTDADIQKTIHVMQEYFAE